MKPPSMRGQPDASSQYCAVSSKPTSVVSQKSVGSRHRAGPGGGPPRGPWLLRVAGGENLSLVALYECPVRVATQRVPRRGPPPRALSTSSWDRTQLIDRVRSAAG